MIVEALEALYPEPRLVPTSPLERALVRRWEALADGICDVLIPVVVDGRRPEGQQDSAYASKLEGKVRACFDFIEPQLQGREGVGAAFSLADIAVVCALGYVNLRRPQLLEGRAGLVRYMERQLARPSLAATVPTNLPIRG